MLGNKPRFQAAVSPKRKRSTIYFTFFHVFYCRTVSRPKCAESGQTVETGEADETLAHSPLANNSNFKGPTVALLPDFACKGNPPGTNYPPLLAISSSPHCPSTFQKSIFSPPCKEYLTRSKHRFPLEKVIKIDIPRIPNPSRHFFLSLFENRRKKSTHVFFSHFYLFRFFLSSFLFARFPLPREVRSGDFSQGLAASPVATRRALGKQRQSAVGERLNPGAAESFR